MPPVAPKTRTGPGIVAPQKDGIPHMGRALPRG
jgi:hypothetical protein